MSAALSPGEKRFQPWQVGCFLQMIDEKPTLIFYVDHVWMDRVFDSRESAERAWFEISCALNLFRPDEGDGPVWR